MLTLAFEDEDILRFYVLLVHTLSLHILYMLLGLRRYYYWQRSSGHVWCCSETGVSAGSVPSCVTPCNFTNGFRPFYKSAELARTSSFVYRAYRSQRKRDTI